MLIDSIDWLGHAAFRITLGRASVYIDPYRVPEGTRVRDPDNLGHPRRGAGRLALDTGAPLVPCAITGTEKIFRGGFPVPRRVQVAFSPPISVAELEDGRVVLTVRDKGHWIERGSEGTARYRGNGLPMMQALMDSVELTHENGDGTAVRMARSLSPDRVVAGA